MTASYVLSKMRRTMRPGKGTRNKRSCCQAKLVCTTKESRVIKRKLMPTTTPIKLKIHARKRFGSV